MASLKEKTQQILNDKNTNLLPENLKSGVTCLGVEGNFKQDVKLFATEEEMKNDNDKSLGVIGLVQPEVIRNVELNDYIVEFRFVSEFTLDAPLTKECGASLEPLGKADEQSRMRLDANYGDISIETYNYNGTHYRAMYECQEDGVTYKAYNDPNNTPLDTWFTLPVTFQCKPNIYYSLEWNDALSKMMEIRYFDTKKITECRKVSDTEVVEPLLLSNLDTSGSWVVLDGDARYGTYNIEKLLRIYNNLYNEVGQNARYAYFMIMNDTPYIAYTPSGYNLGNVIKEDDKWYIWFSYANYTAYFRPIDFENETYGASITATTSVDKVNIDGLQVLPIHIYYDTNKGEVNISNPASTQTSVYKLVDGTRQDIGLITINTYGSKLAYVDVVTSFTTTEGQVMNGESFIGINGVSVGTMTNAVTRDNIWDSYQVYSAMNKLVFPANASNMFSANSMTHAWNHVSVIDCTGFDMTNVENANGMFSSCYDVIELDFRNTETPNLTTVNHMFSYCEELTYLDISKMTFDKVTSYTGMFTASHKLQTVLVKDQNAKTFIDARLSEAGISITSTIKV